MPGSDLRRRSRNGETSSRNRAVTAGSTPASIGAAQTRRNALRLPSSPGVAQSRIAQSSVSSFSTGVPVRATRAALGIRAQRAGGRRAGVLDVLGLVGDDQVPGDRRPGPRASTPHGAVGREHERRGRPDRGRRGRGADPWNRRTGSPGANRSISASQLPSSEAGQTTRVGPEPPRVPARCRASAIRVTVLPRPMSSARQAPSPSEVSWSSQVRPWRW